MILFLILFFLFFRFQVFDGLIADEGREGSVDQALDGTIDDRAEDPAQDRDRFGASAEIFDHGAAQIRAF